ncbi:septal ring lytic transglycosylase RlpA family protein [Noviherbaspirillum massiliense]|uniref:septal ring lytic transglycosylase RlpA family protein n=1 Tax=Noviherbaspirillum massiliense TaxID=1465823 RepID=UPI000556D449|nr:septal ring lytic transglycosylase RlpA family protein [Noviherbaspirillum massiliense]
MSALLIAGCSTAPLSPSATTSASRPSGKSSSANIPKLPPAGSGRGAYYQDDGPGDNPPEGLLDLEDPEPRVEPYSSRGNRPYVVFGKTYRPFTDLRPFKQRGIGSWYGKKFHGQKTSSGEPYDMYKMTAAHPTLPIPSYARITNLANGKQVIVRVNDRGPFHSSRIIDLSYAAALKLGYLANGSSTLEVERLLPDEIARIADSKREQMARGEGSQSNTETQAASVAEGASAVGGNIASSSTPATQEAAQTAAAGASATTAASGIYLQLGAYAQAGNAETARARLMKNWDLSLPTVEVAVHGMGYRLYAGPFASRTEAALAAQKLQQAGAPKPMIVQR